MAGKDEAASCSNGNIFTISNFLNSALAGLGFNEPDSERTPN